MSYPGKESGAVILFGASWCAPCRAELRNLPELASAVAPARIEIAWIDRAPRVATRAAGPNVVVIPPAEAQRKFAAIAGVNQALPVAAMIDASGRTCAIARAPATIPVLQGLVARCLR